MFFAQILHFPSLQHKMPWFHEEGSLSKNQILTLVRKAAQQARERINGNPKKVLLLPPDITRAHSGAGWITEEFYKIFSETSDVHLIPTDRKSTRLNSSH